MRYPEHHKADVRERLVELASRVVRRDGVAGSSVGRVMASAKMTVGGFYKHFASHDALVGEALAAALRDARASLLEGTDELSGLAFERALLGRYLSHHHFANVERGCPVAANVSELSRLSAVASEPLLAEVRSLHAHVAARVRGAGSAQRAEEDAEAAPTAAETRAWVLLSTCVGAMAVARALGPRTGPSVLAAMRQALLAETDHAS